MSAAGEPDSLKAPQTAAKATPLANVNLDPIAQLLAASIVHFAVGSEAATQPARAQMLMSIAGCFIAENDGDLATASADFATIVAGITDPALKSVALNALATAGNYVTGISKLTSATVLGVGLTSLLNTFWTGVSSLASAYVPAAAAAPAKAS